MSFVAATLLIQWQSIHRHMSRRRLNAARHRISTPTSFEVPQGTRMNFSFGSTTNTGSFNFPPQDLKPSDGRVCDSTEEGKAATNLEGSAASNLSEEKKVSIPCVLDQPDETSDLILEVQGKQLHTCRAVLAHYSPVFRSMLYSDFKEKDEKIIALPGKQISDIEVFFNVMFPTTVGSTCLVNDNNLLQLLAMADEYAVEQVKVVCQDYIGAQLGSYRGQFYDFWTTTADGKTKSSATDPRRQEPNNLFGRGNMSGCSIPLPIGRDSFLEPTSPERQAWIDKFLLYLHACHQYDLTRHKEDVKQMVVLLCRGTSHVFMSASYADVPLPAKVELLEDLCRKFETKPN